MSNENIYRPPHANLEKTEARKGKGNLTEGGVDSSLEVSGFWRRAAAYLLDAIIVAPLAMLLTYLCSGSRDIHLLSAIPGFSIGFFYSVWLVQKYGGTPGKLLLGIQIRMNNGAPVTFVAAFVRYAPLMLLSALGVVAGAMAAQTMSEAEYQSLGFFERAVRLQQLAPNWNAVVTVGMQVWIWGGIIVLLLNKRRRALHDFLAGTVVVRKRIDVAEKSE